MIKLTKTINGEKVELDLISLGGKSVVRNSCFKELTKKGITRSNIRDAGYEVEEVEK